MRLLSWHSPPGIAPARLVYAPCSAPQVRMHTLLQPPGKAAGEGAAGAAAEEPDQAPAPLLSVVRALANTPPEPWVAAELLADGERTRCSDLAVLLSACMPCCSSRARWTARRRRRPTMRLIRRRPRC